MKILTTEFLPKARSEEIITKEVDGELLVYDVKRDKAHCLNATAAAVWKLCDGRQSVGEIAERLQAEGMLKEEDRYRSPVRSSVSGPLVVVWLALDQLCRAHLLEERSETTEKSIWPQAVSGIAGMSRREAVRRLGLGAAIALPIIASMTAPTAVEAAVSCFGSCHPCSTSATCCGICAPSVPACGSGMRCT